MKNHFRGALAATLLSTLTGVLSGCASSRPDASSKPAKAPSSDDNALCQKRECDCTKRNRCVPEMFDECKCP